MTDELGDQEQDQQTETQLQQIRFTLRKRNALHVADRAGIQKLERRLGVPALLRTVQPMTEVTLRLDDNDYRNQREAELAAQKEKLLRLNSRKGENEELLEDLKSD